MTKEVTSELSFYVINIFLGLGILYSRTGTYVGEWIGGLQQGNGTAHYNNGNLYKGEFWKGLKHGNGVFEVPSKGDIYEGQFRYGLRHGEVLRYCMIV